MTKKDIPLCSESEAEVRGLCIFVGVCTGYLAAAASMAVYMIGSEIVKPRFQKWKESKKRAK